MPIHDLGYRSWNGQLISNAMRWWIVAHTGIVLAWRSRWLRRMLLFAWTPALMISAGFFMYERVVKESLTGNIAYRQFGSVAVFPGSSDLFRALDDVSTGAATPDETRHTVWSWLLMTFFRYPQGFLMVLMVGLIAPPLISRDVGSRAFLLYFSRPLGRSEYILGKAAVIWAYVIAITTVPALALYVLGVLLSPDFSVVLSTWDLPFRILAASTILMIPTTALALCISSLTSESRYASFSWIAIWAMGWVAYALLSISTQTSRRFRGGVAQEDDGWSLISIYHTLGKVQSWVFGLQPDFGKVLPSAILLAAITAVSLLILFRRVSAPMSI